MSLNTFNDYKFHLDNFCMFIQLGGVFLNFSSFEWFFKAQKISIFNIKKCCRTFLLTLSKTIVLKHFYVEHCKLVVKLVLKWSQVKSSIKFYSFKRFNKKITHVSIGDKSLRCISSSHFLCNNGLYQTTKALFTYISR